MAFIVLGQSKAFYTTGRQKARKAALSPRRAVDFGRDGRVPLPFGAKKRPADASPAGRFFPTVQPFGAAKELPSKVQFSTARARFPALVSEKFASALFSNRQQRTATASQFERDSR